MSRMGYDPHRSQTNELVLDKFINSPLSGELLNVPGVKEYSKRILIENGIESSYALLGKFLSFKDNKKDDKSIQDNCDEFFYFLSSIGTSPGYRSSIVQAIALKANQMIPGIYDESVF